MVAILKEDDSVSLLDPKDVICVNISALRDSVELVVKGDVSINFNVETEHVLKVSEKDGNPICVRMDVSELFDEIYPAYGGNIMKCLHNYVKE